MTATLMLYLGAGHLVSLTQFQKKRQGMVLHHFRRGVDGGSNFTEPAAYNFKRILQIEIGGAFD